MIAYQCSRCAMLYDADEYCGCLAGIDPRTNHRELGDATRCRGVLGRYRITNSGTRSLRGRIRF